MRSAEPEPDLLKVVEEATARFLEERKALGGEVEEVGRRSQALAATLSRVRVAQGLWARRLKTQLESALEDKVGRALQARGAAPAAPTPHRPWMHNNSSDVPGGCSHKVLVAGVNIPPRLWQTWCGWKFGRHLGFDFVDQPPETGEICKTCDPALAAERKAARAAAAAIEAEN